MTGHADLIREARRLAADAGLMRSSHRELLASIADALEAAEKRNQEQQEWIDRVGEFSTDAATEAEGWQRRAERVEKERDQARAEVQRSRATFSRCVCYRHLDTPEPPGAGSEVTGP